MAKLVLSDLVNLQNESSAVNTINNNSALIEAAIEDTLSRSGTSPNEMNANLDMNSNRILNLPLPVAEQEPVRKGEFDEWTGLAEDLEDAVAAAQLAQAAAAASAQDAEDALDEFDDIYLGSKTSDPTLDNDGDPLVTGQLYWNSVASNLRIYDGASWNVYSASSGLTAVVDDTNPALGGNLDLNGHVITGLEIGTNVQAYSANLGSWSAVIPSDYLTTSAAAAGYQPLASKLTDIAALAATDSNIIVGNGTTWVAESGGTARTSLGLGTGDSPQFTGVNLTEAAAPSTPASGILALYAKTDSKLYTKDDAGTEREVGADAGREVLTADRTYYVRTDGSDSNSGLANTSGGAFLTISRAISVVFGLDLNGHNVTISLGTGVGGGISVSGQWVGRGTVSIVGNPSSPGDNVTSGMTCSLGARVSVSGLRFVSSYRGIEAYAGAAVTIAGKCEFGACTSAHISAEGSGTVVTIASPYDIIGSAANHYLALGYGQIIKSAGSSYTINVTGTPAFTTFAYAISGYIGLWATTFSGAATGKRYSAELNGILNTFGGGASYFPGNSAGSTSTGGQYQ